jgi:hypothetical protein
MYEITIDAENPPEWAIGYFSQFREWYQNIAPKPLPKSEKSYISLFSKHIKIDYDIISNISSDQSRIESFTFTWNTDQERTFLF